MHDDRFAPPQAHVEDVQPPGNALALASRGRRFGAACIDVALSLVLLGLISRLTPWNPFQAPTGGFWFAPQFGNSLGGFVVFVVLNGYLLLTRGQTIGKWLLKIRIGRPDGSLASPTRMLLRYGVGSAVNILPALGQIFGLLDALLIFRTSRRCLHDDIADTVVLQAR